MDFSKYLGWLKLKPRYLFALAVLSLILLFLPEPYLKDLGIISFRDDYRTWIGITLLVSTVLFLTHGATKGSLWLKDFLGYKINLSRRKKALENLTQEEKEILRRFLENESRTRSLSYESGIVTGLVDKGIIYRASNVGQSYLRGRYHFDYNIRSWAWDHIRENQQLIDLDANGIDA